MFTYILNCVCLSLLLLFGFTLEATKPGGIQVMSVREMAWRSHDTQRHLGGAQCVR